VGCFRPERTFCITVRGRFRNRSCKCDKIAESTEQYQIIHYHYGCIGYFSRPVPQSSKEILLFEVIQRFGVMSCQTQVTKSKQTLLRIIVCLSLGFRRWVTSAATCLSSRPPSKTVHPSRRYLGISSPASSGLSSESMDPRGLVS
jgi:hypothetical protein